MYGLGIPRLLAQLDSRLDYWRRVSGSTHFLKVFRVFVGSPFLQDLHPFAPLILQICVKILLIFPEISQKFRKILQKSEQIRKF